MELLLNEFSLVHRLHADTKGGVNLGEFKLDAWCARPELLPSSMDLHVVELAVEGMLIPRTLVGFRFGAINAESSILSSTAGQFRR